MIQNLNKSRVLSSSQKSCRSVILLSPGRTATDTVSHTIVESSSLAYCDNTKEYFGHGKLPSSHALHSCFQRHQNNGGVYIHVKPEHIILNAEKYKHKEILTSPQEFFTSARKIGFSYVVTSFRDNQLAREISKFEMYAPAPGTQKFLERAKKYLINTNLTELFDEKVKDFNECVKAAKYSKMKIISISFLDIVSDLCKTSEKITDFVNCPTFYCKKESGHRDKSHHGRSMKGRVGPEAEESIIKQLTNTPYEWMLDLDATTWPKNVKRPRALES